MKYVGSKNKYAKYILPIILKDRQPNQYYVEPFCGGCNLIDKVDGLRIANDTNYFLIEMFKAIQNGWQPPDTLSNKLYNEIRLNKDKFEPCLVGFVGFGCSYAGKWFGGYARGKNNFGQERNYCLESKNNIMAQKAGLLGIEFYNKSYKDLEIPSNSVIYCDPPYQHTVKYAGEEFNHDEFWQWCRNQVINGNKVFISEYNAPSDFQCIWEKDVFNTLDQNTSGKKGTERLFIIYGR